ncbi:molybdate transport system substrate-binding protein [Methylohalomonas lacus]|uniref:Molybdate transport system substrate-binding protein n=1 Tax=Methylohalomonas lacus TaxID=398773 RepID=A0AAE3HM27_9GAMM|nr:molybdate ABC transporter substrate-binding protein [Methylohalomonas lacus]MCS3904310.1 molybdate transport system substrate-binding protein [Methylohalomonas lacus]
MTMHCYARYRQASIDNGHSVYRLLTAALLLALLALQPGTVQADDVPIVAAASDLQFALEEIAQDFTATSGRRVRLNFGSSGNFRRQIAQGAPFEVYLSADEAYVRALYREGHTRDAGDLYAIGRVAMIATEKNASVVDPDLVGLGRQLASGLPLRFAIANPEHAPYGVAARQVLQSRGLWSAIQPRLILGENVSQATQFALSGNTIGGLVAYSLALAPPLRERSVHALIPAKYHEPLRQRMVLLKDAGTTARAFYAYLQSAAARRIFNRYGFVLPDEDATAQ